MIGAGAHTCREARAAVLSNPDLEDSLTNWALGFITGTLRKHDGTKYKKEFDISAIKPRIMKSFIARYCNQFPDKDYFEAVDAYLLSLPLIPTR